MACCTTAVVLAALAVTPANGRIESSASLPVRCVFDQGGVGSIYILERDHWRARRADVRPARQATLDINPKRYRLSFRPANGNYRIAVEIERADGAARRTFGPVRPGAAGPVVQEGHCRAPFGQL